MHVRIDGETQLLHDCTCILYDWKSLRARIKIRFNARIDISEQIHTQPCTWKLTFYDTMLISNVMWTTIIVHTINNNIVLVDCCHTQWLIRILLEFMFSMCYSIILLFMYIIHYKSKYPCCKIVVINIPCMQIIYYIWLMHHNNYYS